jgi:hypothetical protein
MNDRVETSFRRSLSLSRTARKRRKNKNFGGNFQKKYVARYVLKERENQK